jgi:hypothetical protein
MLWRQSNSACLQIKFMFEYLRQIVFSHDHLEINIKTKFDVPMLEIISFQTIYREQSGR